MFMPCAGSLWTSRRVNSWRSWGHRGAANRRRSEEHTSELQSRHYLVCRLLLEKKSQLLDPLVTIRFNFGREDVNRHPLRILAIVVVAAPCGGPNLDHAHGPIAHHGGG